MSLMKYGTCHGFEKIIRMFLSKFHGVPINESAQKVFCCQMEVEQFQRISQFYYKI